MESFIIQDWKLFAPIHTGGEKTYAHLDTGAIGNMLSASKLDNAEVIDEKTMMGAMGEQQVKEVRIKDLTFLEQEFDHTKAVIFDGEQYFGDVPFPVTMTLGATVLLAKPLILDFKRLWLGFAESPVRADIPAYPMDFANGLPFLELNAGKTKLQTIFDTGAAYSLFNLAHETEAAWEFEEIYQLEALDPTGARSLIPVFELKNVTIGDVQLGKMEIVKVDLTAIEQRLDKRVDFVLGANALISSGLVWVLDSAKETIYISEHDVNVCVQGRE